MSAGQFSTSPNSLVGLGVKSSAAYSLGDLQALGSSVIRVSDAGTVRLAPADRYRLDATGLTFVPYVYGQSDPRLRPAV